MAEHRPGHWLAHVRILEEGAIFCVNDSQAVRNHDDEFPEVHVCLIVAQRDKPFPPLPPLIGLNLPSFPIPGPPVATRRSLMNELNALAEMTKASMMHPNKVNPRVCR